MIAHQLPLTYPIDTGAPVPKILASEQLLLLFYFTSTDCSDALCKTIIPRDAVNDRGVNCIEFEDCLNFKFGYPNNEVLQGHPYYKLGVRPYSFFELEGSDWKQEIIQQNSIHPRHDASLFDSYKHFVLPFHDSLFECVASGYTSSFSTRSMGELIAERVESFILVG